MNPQIGAARGEAEGGSKILCWRMLGALVLLAVIAWPGLSRPGSASDPALEQAIRSFILENPEVIIESLERYQTRQRAEMEQQAALAVEANRAALEMDPLSPVAGNPKGDVTVVEFFDYQCGYCKRVVPSIRELLENDPGIRYVFKEFPVLGDTSVTAARAALAVWLLDRDLYAPFHFELMSARGTLTEDRILDMASKLGVDRDALAEKMNAGEVMAMLESNLQLAQSINVRGTPAFVIGGKLVPGAIDLETMQSLVASAREG